MARRKDSEDARRRILSVCVKLFIENGYKNTRMTDIITEARVSNSTFQNLFGTKDGVLMDLAEFMFENQFSIAKQTINDSSPVFVYAIETAIQLVITEINENIREIYVHAYSSPDMAEYIYQETSTELYGIFGKYMPECSESDFYEMEIGSAGMMRNYMAKKCDKYFNLNKKIETFLKMSFRAYNVPKNEIDNVLNEISSIDIVGLAKNIINKLLESLAMEFEFKFNNI